ncbi:hypothetical protein [Candidatus Uabimicrobium amorphum]|uniref:Uncharacterized protein n=1 Tax=Uabimicrobium amorphum TaxID=2596890 RepID=A0A5S9IPV9_UABAM|nr:hypothetical protein [Candidatus Uabimicrobium amorphum]BBM85704.1 hypothetical protein UABAM_04079 [Candidatus Uabimicrobium amorphum]
MATTWNTNKYANNGYKLLVIAAIATVMFICHNIFKQELFFWAGVVTCVVFFWVVTLAVFAAAEKISQ